MEQRETIVRVVHEYQILHDDDEDLQRAAERLGKGPDLLGCSEIHSFHANYTGETYVEHAREQPAKSWFTTLKKLLGL